jgi:hypothetical protein
MPNAISIHKSMPMEGGGGGALGIFHSTVYFIIKENGLG